MEILNKSTHEMEPMISTQEKSHLIKGTFSAADARKILLEMVQNKINFHNRQIHIIQEQTGGDTSYSENRIDELYAITEKIKELLVEAESKNRKIRIECPLLIEVQ